MVSILVEGYFRLVICLASHGSNNMMSKRPDTPITPNEIYLYAFYLKKLAMV